jgi:hypothetical protein
MPIDSGTLVTLARGACYGSCPVYSLTIAGDGSVTYNGEAFVRVMGPASGNVPVEGVQALVDQMLRANYFNLSVPMTCPEHRDGRVQRHDESHSRRTDARGAGLSRQRLRSRRVGGDRECH